MVGKGTRRPGKDHFLGREWDNEVESVETIQRIGAVSRAPKGSSRETFRTQAEGNNEVWVLNEIEDKATTMLSKICETCENIGKRWWTWIM